MGGSHQKFKAQDSIKGKGKEPVHKYPTGQKPASGSDTKGAKGKKRKNEKDHADSDSDDDTKVCQLRLQNNFFLSIW